MFIRATLLLMGLIVPVVVRAYPTVGSTSNPGGLLASIQNAYNSGTGGVVIAPGTYNLPAPSGYWCLDFNNMANFVIQAKNVTLLMADGVHGGMHFGNCQNVTLDGLVANGCTFTTLKPNFTQGSILSGGSDAAGSYLDVQIDAGYPSDLNNTAVFTPYDGTTFALGYNFDKNSRRYKTKEIDFGVRSAAVLDFASRKWRFHVDNSAVLPGNGLNAIGDPICLIGAMPHGIGLDNCTVTLKNLNLPWGDNGSYEGGGGPNRWINVRGTYQTKPSGATATALMGFNGVNVGSEHVGPDVEGCAFEGAPDDMWNLHAAFEQVGSISGMTLTVGAANFRNDIQNGDTLRFYDQKLNLIDTAQVTSAPLPVSFTQPFSSHWGEFQNASSVGYYTLSLSHAVTAPYDTLVEDASACCAGAKFLNNRITNIRSCGLLLKGDNPDVENNMIDGCSGAGVAIFCSTGWGEAGFVHGATIKNNTIMNCGYWDREDLWTAGALTVGMDPDDDTITGEDHQNILIQNNTFDNNAGVDLSVKHAAHVRILGNTFQNTHFAGLRPGVWTGFDPGSVIWLGQCQDITLARNTVSNLGPSATALVTAAATALAVHGIGSGVTQMGKTFTLVNRDSSLLLDTTGDGVQALQWVVNDAPSQHWTFAAAGGGYFTAANASNGKLLGVNNSLATGQRLQNETANSSASQQWSFAPADHGYGALVNKNSLLSGSINLATNGGAPVTQQLASSRIDQQWSLRFLDDAAAYYAFNDNGGAAAADNSGHGNNGALIGGAGWTLGLGGSAASLSGSGQYVDLSRPVLNTAQSFSVSCWVKLNAITNWQTFASQTIGNTASFFLQLRADGHFGFTTFAADNYTNGVTAASTFTPQPGVWYHLAGVYNQPLQQIKLYVNGVLQSAQYNAVTASAPGHTLLGSAFGGGAPTDFVGGAIEDTRLYQRALLDSDVTNLAQTFSVPIPPAQCETLFDENSGTTADDASGHGKIGALIGGAGWTDGVLGAAVNLSGAGQYVSLNGPAINTSQSFTVAAWVKLNALGGYQTILSQDGANISAFFLQARSDNHFIFIVPQTDSTGSSLAGAWAPTAAITGQWTQLIGVYDASNGLVKLYINGVLTASTSCPGAFAAAGGAQIGRGKWNGPVDFWNGAIDSVREYQRAFSDADALSYYNTGQ